jgi:hypothetical protein
MRVLKIVAAASILTAGSLLSPSAGHADDPCIGDAPGCPTFGHLVCQEIDAGLKSRQIAENAKAAYGLDEVAAAALVADAIANYCPGRERN